MRQLSEKLNKSYAQLSQWRNRARSNLERPTRTGLENLYIVTGFGNSMPGAFNKGDPLIVDTGVQARDYGYSATLYRYE